MKKKLLFSLILVVAICCLTLTACDGGVSTDYTGNATIELNFDANYDNVLISCPSATITKDNNAKYTLTLSNTMPVDVIVSAEGKEPQTFSFTNEELKNGTVKKTITFSNAKYRMRIGFSKQVEPNVLTEGVSIVPVGDDYELVSDVKINKTVEIALGEKYYNVFINADQFNYVFDNYGKINEPIQVVEKSANKALVYSNEAVSLVSLTTGKEHIIEANNRTFLKMDDYIVKRMSSYEAWKYISKEDMQQSPYYNINVEYANNLAIDSKLISDVDFYLDNIEKDYIHIEVDGHYSHSELISIKSKNPIYVGSIVKVKKINDDADYLYQITEEDVKTGVLHTSNEALVKYEYNNEDNIWSKTFKFKFYNQNNQPITLKTANVIKDIYNSVTGERDFVKEDITNGFIFNNVMDFELVDDKGVNYQIKNLGKYIGDLQNYLLYYTKLNKSTTNEYEVPLKIEPVYTRTFNFVDVVTKKVIYSKQVDNIVDLDYIYLDTNELREKGYSVKNKMYNNQFVFAVDYFKEPVINIEVEKSYSVKVTVTNRGDFPYNSIWLESDNYQGVLLSLYNSDTSDNFELVVLESQIGDIIRYKTSSNQYYGKYEQLVLDVSLTRADVENGNIQAELKGIENEWLDVTPEQDRYFY